MPLSGRLAFPAKQLREVEPGMSLLTWTVNSGGHFAEFGHGRYSVARTHGRVPRFVARWHRSRSPFNQGQNITGAPTIEAAKAACERHAQQRTDNP